MTVEVECGGDCGNGKWMDGGCGIGIGDNDISGGVQMVMDVVLEVEGWWRWW